MRSRLLSFCAILACFIVSALVSSGAVFTVTNTLNSGAGSFRQAILDANTNAGPDTINFAIPGTGTKTIALSSVLPAITEPVMIDGSTQTGYTNTPLVVLDGQFNSTITNGLTITTSNSTVRALMVIKFYNTSANGSGIRLIGGSNGVFGCFIGTDGTRVTDQRNSGPGVFIDNSANNVIGGIGLTNRNVISDNRTNVLIFGASATNNQIIGNTIGTKATGAPLNGANPGLYTGIAVRNAPGNQIGGLTAGQGNLISWNNTGVLIGGASATGNVVQGNFIGTGPGGSNGVPNVDGVTINGSASGNTIGGMAAGAGNLISANQKNGILIDQASGNIVQGNLIGTDGSGQLSLGNCANTAAYPFSSGIYIQSIGNPATNNLIGGTSAAARNVISGNTNRGVFLSGLLVMNNLVQGNFIGVAANGTTPLRNAQSGVFVGESQFNTIGGAAGAGNVIANNGADGITLTQLFGGGISNVVTGNIIASNAAAGVNFTAPTIISQNSIHDNGGLGLTRGGASSDTNNIAGQHHHFPIITNAMSDATSTTVSGYLTNDTPNTPFTLEFFASPNADPSGFGEGQNYLGSTDVTTDVGGNASFNVTFPVATSTGYVATATSTGEGTPSEASTFAPVVVFIFGGAGSFSPPPDGLTFANTSFAGIVGHPISTFTGELFEQLPPDLALDGPMPLVFARYYAAFLKQDGLIAGQLGDNWLHNFEMTLTVTASNTVNIVNHLGRLISFTNNAGNFTLIGRQDVPFQLATNGVNFALGDPASQRLFTFDATGKLISIADGHGNSHTLTYAGAQLASVSDGLGRTFTFQYNGSGQLTNVSDGVRSVAFTQSGNNLESARTPLGFVTTYSYDLASPLPALMTATTMPEGNVPFSQTFNTNGQVLTQTAAGTNVWSLNYAGATTTVTNPAGNIVEDTHTPTGELSAYKDEAGQTLPIGSNAKRQRALVTDRLGNSTGIAYHAPSGKPSALTNADGTITTFSYAARTTNGVTFYDLSQVVYPDGASESFTYDTSGNVKTRADQAGNVFGFSHNARGQILTATNPLGGVITFTYDANGQLASAADSDTGVTAYQYDSLHRITNVIRPDGSTLNALYDADDRLTSVTDERLSTTRFFYDANGRLTQVRDANGRTNQFSYDSHNRLVKTIDRLGQTASVGYDALNHVVALTNRNSFVTLYNYDVRQRLTAITDAGSQNWRFSHDLEGLVSATSNPLNQTNRIGRDLLGLERSATNALGQFASVARDAMRRVTQVIDGLLRTNTFAYDARGVLTNVTRPLVGSVGYERNALGLLSRITGRNGEQWNYAYTPMGRVASLADPLQRTNRYEYDIRGRLKRGAFADGVTSTNTYDVGINLIRRQYSSGPNLQYTYDALDRLVTANDLAFAYDAESRVTNTVSSGFNYGAAYDADGRLTSVTYNNGALTVNYTYDNRNRLTRVTDTLTGTQLDFTHDDAGRLIGLTRPNGVNGAYNYDAAGQRMRIQEGSIVDLQYGYNPAGEITNVNFTAPLDPANFLAPANPVLDYDAAHQVANPGYGFDARGRQTAAPGHAFAWDGASRLTGIGLVTISYNGVNDIATRALSGVITRYFHNYGLRTAPIMAELNASATLGRYYVWTPAGRLLYVINVGASVTVSHVHTDRIGSVLALTSSAGAVTDAYAYTPYGVLLARTGTNPQPFTYIGAFGVRSEPAANLYQMRARYYEPVTARFLSKDPLWPRLRNPDSLNPYQYALRNPIAFLDPQGRQDEETPEDDGIGGDDESPPGDEDPPGDETPPSDVGTDSDMTAPGVYTKANWPGELTKRPITLAKGMLEIQGDIFINMNKAATAKPFVISPNIFYGVSSKLTIQDAGNAGMALNPDAIFNFMCGKLIQPPKPKLLVSEAITVPIRVSFQPTSKLAAFLDTGISGPLNPFGDFYAVPSGIGALFAPANKMDVGLRIKFHNVGDGEPGSDPRKLDLLTNFRL